METQNANFTHIKLPIIQNINYFCKSLPLWLPELFFSSFSTLLLQKSPFLPNKQHFKFLGMQ
jgi:hypothetical protein